MLCLAERIREIKNIMNHTEAFAYFGAIPRNVYWSWSARTSDGKSVVVTLWQHEFKGRAGAMTYSRSDRDGWHDGAGYREFIDNLQWAIESCDSKVRVIIAVSKDRENPKISSCEPKDWPMKVVSLNPETGAFVLEQIRE
jgi:hypothetical protein